MIRKILTGIYNIMAELTGLWIMFALLLGAMFLPFLYIFGILKEEKDEFRTVKGMGDMK